MEASAPGLGELGPYRLVEHLGTGAMGTVYRAEDGETTVAVKVIHPHLLERQGFFLRFQREAAAGRQVAHPNVVQTHHCDLLVVDGIARCFLVMEYVEGKTLRELLRELGVVPETLVREIGRQVASGLSAIHEAGIVHRDLKPENVLITHDHQIRIMDLGVARWRGGEGRLTQEGQFAGSLVYAAPEQFEGGEISPQTDLYGLGVLLYELSTGQNPFRHAEPQAVMHAHLEAPPPELRAENPEVSPFLSEITATLLAKRAVERFGSAEALADLLKEGERSDWWSERERSVLARQRRFPKVPVRRETALYGRETDLAQLRRLWSRARAGHGNVLLLEGEAGIGKTRLVDALLRELTVEDVHVLYGSYPPVGGLGGISDAILEHLGHADLEEALRGHLGASSSLAPAFAALLRREVPPADAGSLQGGALHAAAVQLMRSLAAEKPLLWVVEDLHFADADGLGLMLSLARALEERRILLLLTTRPGLAPETLAELGYLDNLQRSGLGRLGARDIVLLLRDALKNERLVEKLAPKIAVKSDGVPFFVYEMIRGLKEGQFISELPDGSYIESSVIEEIEVPSAVKDLVAVRLQDLSRQERNLLDAAAVLGFTFDTDLVARALEIPHVRALQHLASIERRSGVVRASGSGYRFDHHQVQEVVFDALPDALRAEYHTLLADAFQDREGLRGAKAGPVAGEAAAFVAEHHLRGRRSAAAAPYVLTGLEHLSCSFRVVAATELAQRALAVPGLLQRADKARTLLHLAGNLQLLGRREDQRATLDLLEAELSTVPDADLSARAGHAAGKHALATSDFAAAEAAFGKAIDAARDAGNARLECRSRVGIGIACHWQRRFAEGRQHYEQGRDIAAKNGDLACTASASGNLGILAMQEGRLEEARHHYEEQLGLGRRTGGRETEVIAMLNLGRVAGKLGQADEAQDRYQGALDLSRRFGFREREASAVACLAGVCERRGRYEESRDGYERAREICGEIGNRLGVASQTRSLGWATHTMGRTEEALDHVERALDLARVLGDEKQEGFCRITLANIAEDSGDLTRARSLCQETLAWLGASGSRTERARALLVWGRVEGAVGNADDATAHLDHARALALEVNDAVLALLASSERVLLPGGDVDAFLAEYAALEERATHGTRMGVQFTLWKATGEAQYLREAHRLLMESRESVSAAHRQTMMENVPLFRDIAAAWKTERARRDDVDAP